MHEANLIEAPRFAPEMRKAVLGGGKTCITRSEKKGEVGDRWPLENKMYEYTKIERHSLDHVAAQLYREEGFNSPGEFRDTWCRLHRMKPEKHPEGHPYWRRETRYTHHFKEVKP